VWPNWFVAGAFYHNREFGLLFMLGLILDTALKVWVL
jgi:1,4-dihydroxy-2-naphthoate octaprenyltransferase